MYAAGQNTTFLGRQLSVETGGDLLHSTANEVVDDHACRLGHIISNSFEASTRQAAPVFAFGLLHAALLKLKHDSNKLPRSGVRLRFSLCFPS